MVCLVFSQNLTKHFVTFVPGILTVFAKFVLTYFTIYSKFLEIRFEYFPQNFLKICSVISLHTPEIFTKFVQNIS